MGWMAQMLHALLECLLPHSVLASTLSSHSSPLKSALQRAPLPKVTQMRALAVQSPRIPPLPVGELTTLCTYRYEPWPFPQVRGQRTLVRRIPSTFHVVGAQLVSFPFTERLSNVLEAQKGQIT